MIDENIVRLPDRRERLVADIRKGLELMDEGAVKACIAMAELRAEFPDNPSFSGYLKVNGITLNDDTRAAMIHMGRAPDTLRGVLAKTKRRSLDTIYRFEWPSSKFSEDARRKKPSPAPAYEAALHIAEQKAAAGEPLKPRDIAAEAGVSKDSAEDAVRSVRHAAEQKVETVDLAQLPDKGRARVEKALEIERKRLERTFEARVWAETYRREQLWVDTYGEHIRQADEIRNAWNGVMPRDTYRALLALCHPDNSMGPERRAALFQWLRDNEHLLVKPEKPVHHPVPGPGILKDHRKGRH